MSIGFLITSPYQVHHYKRIARELSDTTSIIEVREQEFGLTEEFVRTHLPDSDVRWVTNDRLADLDGKFDVIVCQTPLLPLEFPTRSLVVAQQYSLAKEKYQYGVWRAHAHLNLMYGRYSVERVQGFCRAVAVGNPLLDPLFQDPLPERQPIGSHGRRPRLLYAPTYGELSSLPKVLPRLRDIDADITLKLHHAQALEVVDKVPDGVRVVRSDADPIEMFRTHDGVISDVSGAVHDALYAGLPVVIASTVRKRHDERGRLSSSDLDHAMVADVAAIWRPGEDIFEAFRVAEQRLASPAYREFVDTMFVNPGGAGAECARQIKQLLAEGEQLPFGAAQVRDATKRYILLARRRRKVNIDEETGEMRLNDRPAMLKRRRFDLRRAYRRARQVAASSDWLKRNVHRVRRVQRRIKARALVRELEGPRPLPTPAGRREAVFEALLPHLQAENVSVVRDGDAPGAAVAILVSDRKAVRRALLRLAEQQPHLQVRIGNDYRITATLPLTGLRPYDMVNAHWLEVGTPYELGTYRIGVDGFLTLLFIEYNQDKQRYLALRTRYERVDWTPEFSSPKLGATPLVAARKPHLAEPVDLVYTWVDSTDPEWQREHRRFSEQEFGHIPSANNAERYVDRDELRYSLRSVWMFAPFVRHIYIVTAGHRPAWLATDHPRISVISHQEIFPDPSALPTFNSHAIEACLHRIPGLSEHFVYFNDDVFLGREATPDSFFTLAGLAKVRLAPTQYIYQGKPTPTAIPTDWAAYNTMALLQRDFGMTFDRRQQHVPLPQRKSVLEELEKRYPDAFERTRAARFRSTNDVAVPSMLAPFYGIATGKAVEWPAGRNEYIYLDTGRYDLFDRFDQILSVRPKFFCLNVTRHQDISIADQAKYLRQFLTPAFPAAAPWEVG
ncbi:MAG TPA: stealth conserved region 3 domain-containing protein [Natronosporangium sp.]